MAEVLNWYDWDFMPWTRGSHCIARINFNKVIRLNQECEKNGERKKVKLFSNLDWLDEDVPIGHLAELLDLIRRTPNLDWLLLTKRPDNWYYRLADAANCVEGLDEDFDGSGYFPETPLSYWLNEWLGGQCPQNVWIGTSVENQEMADKRIPELLKIPARVRFLSCEPLLSAVDLIDAQGYWIAPMVDWVICGGESGPDARPMDAEWARSLRDQCKNAGLPFFFKQWGEFRPVRKGETDRQERHCWIDDAEMWRSGKKESGRLLDGVEHSEFPEVLESGVIEK